MSFTIVGMYDKYSPEVRKELIRLTQNDKGVIRRFLLTEKYIDVHDHKFPKDILNLKGEKAKKLGGHKQYKEWEIKEEKRKNIENFPKKNWILYDAGKILGGILLGILINQFICHTTKSDQPTNTPNKDTIQKPTTSPPAPKVSGKKDSL